MTTEVAVARQVEPLLFSVTEATIQPLAEKYMLLQISGIDDKEGLELVKTARLDCVKARTTIERERVAAKAEYLEAGKKVDLAAKALTAMLAPVENYLLRQESAVKDEIARVEKATLDEMERDRKHALDGAGGNRGGVMQIRPIREMTKQEFADFLRDVLEGNEAYDAQQELKRIENERIQKEREAEAEKNRIEAERLAEERRVFNEQRQIELDRLERERLEREEAEESLAAQRKELADQQEAFQKQMEAAAEKSSTPEIEPAGSIVSEILPVEAQVYLDKSLSEDREKIIAFAYTLSQLKPPQLSEGCEEASQTIDDVMASAIAVIRDVADRM